MNSNHHPEPWYADIRSGCAAIYPADQRDYAKGLHSTDHGRTIIVWEDGSLPDPRFHYHTISPQQEANLRRIVACVNACAGMKDPAAEIEALRKENGNA